MTSTAIAGPGSAPVWARSCRQLDQMRLEQGELQHQGQEREERREGDGDRRPQPAEEDAARRIEQQEADEQRPGAKQRRQHDLRGQHHAQASTSA